MLYQTESTIKSSFDCKVPSRSPTRPTSVNALRPGDIDIIGAVGDSLTV